MLTLREKAELVAMVAAPFIVLLTWLTLVVMLSAEERPCRESVIVDPDVDRCATGTALKREGSDWVCRCQK